MCFFLVFLPTNTDPGDIVLSSCLEESSPNPLLGQVYIRRGDGKLRWNDLFRGYYACLGWAWNQGVLPSGYVKIAIENDHQNSGFSHLAIQNGGSFQFVMGQFTRGFTNHKELGD